MDFMFIEVEFESGELLRVRHSLQYYEDYLKNLGEWFAPECNSPGCPAFGIIEAMAQDDDYSGLLYSINSSISRVKIYLPEN